MTGQHMVESDWSQCNNCKFPALKSAFEDWYDSEKCCPMCGSIPPEDIIAVEDPSPMIKKYKQMQNSGGNLDDTFGL